MPFSVASSNDKNDAQDLIVNLSSATVNRTLPSIKTATTPLSTIPPFPSAPHDTTFSNQDNEAANIDYPWSK